MQLGANLHKRSHVNLVNPKVTTSLKMVPDLWTAGHQLQGTAMDRASQGLSQQAHGRMRLAGVLSPEEGPTALVHGELPFLVGMLASMLRDGEPHLQA